MNPQNLRVYPVSPVFNKYRSWTSWTSTDFIPELNLNDTSQITRTDTKASTSTQGSSTSLHSLNTHSIVTFTPFNKRNGECTICKTHLQDVIRKLDCKHSFHINCIDTVLSSIDTCPECDFKLN